MTLNGGTFNTGGLSEHELSDAIVTPGIGALTLLSSSTIDFGEGASVLPFANNSASMWTSVLSIYNWSGTPVTGGGTHELYFGTGSTGLTSTQLSQIAFYSDSGTTYLGSAEFLSGMTGELQPVPEPATWFSAVLVAGAIAWSQRYRVARTSAKRNWLSPIIVGLFLVSISSASANPLHIFPETSDAQRAAVLSPSVSAATGRPSIHLGENQSALVSGAPGQTVVLNLRNFRMSGNSTFTLQGTATTTFVINVRRQFSLSDTARIVLSGGVQWNNVTFHVMGTGSDVTLSQYSSLEGMLIANQRTVRMSGHAIVRGSVSARRIVLRGSAQIIQPPILSP